jgi:hypothetical protein
MWLKSLSSSYTLALTLALCAALAPLASEAADPLSVQFTADKADYLRGEEAVLTLSVKNTSALPLVVSFSNGQQYEFAATDANGATLWTWSYGKSFSPSGSQRILSPGETLTVQETFTFVGNDGQGLLDGAYTVSGTFLGNYMGKTGPRTGQQLVTLTTPDPLEVSFTTNKSTYRRFESAVLTLTLTNTASYALTVQFDSAQLYDFTARNSGGSTVWAWSNGKSFDPTPQELVLAPGESVQFQQSWGFVNNSGLAVGDGTYTVSGTFLGQFYGQTGPETGEAQVQLRTLF